MNANKLIRWSRRAAITLFDDWRWRDGRCAPRWLGSPSGGAYVDVSRLNADSIVYSFGIATEISFDRAIIQETGCKVFGFDPDPRSEAWLKRPEIWVPERFTFARLALDAETCRRTFYMTDIEHMTGGLGQTDNEEKIDADCRTLEDIMAMYGHTWIDYLKLDIEAAEYPVLEAWLKRYDRLPVGQLWIEFHPNGRDRTEAMSKSLARRLEKIGMVAAYRNYFRAPNNYLLLNKSGPSR